MKSFKKTSIVGALFALMLSFAFTSSYAQVTDSTNMNQPPTSSSYTLQGKVVDAQTTSAISNATVAVAGSQDSTATDSDGSFELSNLSAGSNTITVKADGYQPWEKDLTLDEDMDQMTIKLKPKQ